MVCVFCEYLLGYAVTLIICFKHYGRIGCNSGFTDVIAGAVLSLYTAVPTIGASSFIIILTVNNKAKRKIVDIEITAASTVERHGEALYILDLDRCLVYRS